MHLIPILLKKMQIFLGPLDVVSRGERTGYFLSLNGLPALLNLIQVNLHIKLVPPICKLENKFLFLCNENIVF